MMPGVRFVFRQSDQLSPGGRADLGGGDDVCYMTHQSYVQQLLRQLHDKISGQLQVLRAMRSSSPSNTEDVRKLFVAF